MSAKNSYRSLALLSLLTLAAAGCLGKEDSSGGGGGSSALYCKDQYDNCYEYSGAPAGATCDSGNGQSSLPGSCAGLAATANSRCVYPPTSGVTSTVYFSPGFYNQLAFSAGGNCGTAKSVIETNTCTTQGGAFTDLEGRHNTSTCS